MADVDRTKQHLVVYDKSGSKKFEGKVEENSVAITGLTAGTVVADGDYQVAWSDGVQESTKVDVPGFTTLTPAPTDATEVTSTATSDGANVSAK
ncbi:hypothetical protein FEZ51_08575 [Pediococcus stilesii]|uniref:Uncharacterized protein n=1 Tax=Pediococcus stilesii TaxID=331679 RepID=A0A5R9BUA2_9LACO|nr:hypothetical protein [Pediococcus stilesii]TLQ03650.1 hypothetical protein FEZ51_08575 [Pediococcus stilesii]